MAGLLLLIPRFFQFIFAMIIIALVGHMISTSGWNAIPRKGGNAAEVNFAMFLGVFAFVTSPILALINFKSIEHVIMLFGAGIIDALNTIFFLGGAIGLSAAMNIHTCSNTAYTVNNGITNSSPNTETRCREAQAVTAFAWFEFILFAFTTLFSFRNTYAKQAEIDHLERSPSRPRVSPPMATTAPAMGHSARDPHTSYHSAAAARSVHSVHPNMSVHSVHPALSAHPANSYQDMRRMSNLSARPRTSNAPETLPPLSGIGNGTDPLGWHPVDHRGSMMLPSSSVLPQESYPRLPESSRGGYSSEDEITEAKAEAVKLNHETPMKI